MKPGVKQTGASSSSPYYGPPLHADRVRTNLNQASVYALPRSRPLIYLSIINAQKSWRQAYNWSAALFPFKIHFGDRLP